MYSTKTQKCCKIVFCQIDLIYCAFDLLTQWLSTKFKVDLSELLMNSFCYLEKHFYLFLFLILFCENYITKLKNLQWQVKMEETLFPIFIKHKIQKMANNKQINIAFCCSKLILIETGTQILLLLKFVKQTTTLNLIIQRWQCIFVIWKSMRWFSGFFKIK